MKTPVMKNSPSLKKSSIFFKHKETDSTLKKYQSTITDLEQNMTSFNNNHFYSVFSHQIPMQLSALCEYLTNLFQRKENDMPDIPVTEKGVLKIQRALNISKAVGPGVIRPRVFKELSTELAPILTLLSQTSLHPEPLPDIWKHANVNPTKVKRQIHPTRTQCP